MTREVQDLYEKASELAPEDRAELAGLLLGTLDYEAEPGLEQAWLAERVRRDRARPLAAIRRRNPALCLPGVPVLASWKATSLSLSR